MIMNNLFNRLVHREEKLSLIGLGYVGLPIAVAFSKKLNVIGFDISVDRINTLKSGRDITGEVNECELADCKITYTCDPYDLRECRFHIIAVPTPINTDHKPDLTPLESACFLVGSNLLKESVVVFESTVYPGLTEEVCIPLLEKSSGMVCGVDFKVGYSPERINPGDKLHRIENIVKIVSGMDDETLDCIAKVYEIIVKKGVHRAESIKVAEAAKVIENCQRDINIAFMNELSLVFHKIGVDTKSVLAAANTKWNFLNFAPGLVGGHCIGVDPFYLTYKAEQLGYNCEVILSGRRINDNMGKYVAENTVKLLLRAFKQVHGNRVAVFGLTFKEDCPDIRNTKVVDIVRELRDYGIEPLVYDPIANFEEAKKEYGIDLVPLEQMCDLDVAVFAVAHESFRCMDRNDINAMFKKSQEKKVIVDVKGIFDITISEDKDYLYWRL